MSVSAFHHVSFTVSDVEAAERFFIEQFGMERIGGGEYDFDYTRRQVGFQDAVLKISVLRLAGGGMLELIEYVRPRGEPADTATNRPGNAHLCFLVEDLDQEYERLSRAGVRFRSSPNVVTYGINKGAKVVYFSGPDNIALELYQPAPAPARSGASE